MTRRDLLYIPQALASLSLFYIVLKSVFGRKTSLVSDKSSDGLTILAYRIIRLLSLSILLGAECYQLAIGEGPQATKFEPAFYVSILVASSLVLY